MKYMLHGNTTIILLKVRLIKKDIVEMSEYFRKPRPLEENC